MIQTETQKIKTIKTVGSICSIKNRFSIAKIISLSRKISTSFFYFSFTLVVLILVSSCNPAKRLLDGENLMASYQVKIDNHSLDKNELENIVKQKPNKAIIRFGNHRYLRFHLWFYNFADIGKPRKYKDWLKRVIGEEPVLLDTFLTKKSTSQLKLFLIKKGFFNSIASDTTIYKHKQAFVTYNLKFGLPYHFRDYDYSIKDTAILNVLLSETSKTLIKQGDNYDEFVLEQERERITKLLRNNGYYYFLKEYIYFDADTSLGSREANITLGIKNPEKKNIETDSIVEGKHEKYYLNNIYIVPDFVAKQKNKIFQDTVLYLNYYFLFDHKMRYRKRILVQPFFLKEGELYSQQNVEETYRLMSNLRAFKFTNVNFEEVKNDSNQHLLNAYLQLSPSPKQAF